MTYLMILTQSFFTVDYLKLLKGLIFYVLKKNLILILLELDSFITRTLNNCKPPRVIQNVAFFVMIIFQSVQLLNDGQMSE